MLAESRQQAARKPPESRGRTDGKQSRDTSHMTRRAASMLAESRQQAARKLRESCQQAEQSYNVILTKLF